MCGCIHIEKLGGTMPSQTVNGIVYPSVTEIIGSTLSKGPGYENWLATKGWKACKSISRKAGSRGTKIHDVLRRTIKNERIPKKYKTYSEDFKSNLLDKEVVLSETPLISEEYGFSGTPDLVYRKDGMTILVDLKTGALRKEVEAQFGGYEILLREKGTSVERVEVWSTKDGFRVVPYASRPDIFLALLEIYKWGM